MTVDKFKSYLLGTATEAERKAIDQNVVTKEEEFEQLLQAEDELIEAYLQKELTETEQTSFEHFFLRDPEHQQKLRLAQGLRQYAKRTVLPLLPHTPPETVATAAPKQFAFRRRAWQCAIAGILLIIGALCWRTLFTAPEVPQIAESTPSPSVTATPRLTAGTEIASVQLYPGVSRAVGNSLPTVTISPKIGQVKFKLLLLTASHTSYEAILQADDEAEQLLPGAFQPQTERGKTYVLVTVAATSFGNGGYRLKLAGQTPGGAEKVATYSFTVKR